MQPHRLLLVALALPACRGSGVLVPVDPDGGLPHNALLSCETGPASTGMDGVVTFAGPTPLSSAADYGLLRALHPGEPEGEYFSIFADGHVLAVSAILFADGTSGSMRARLHAACNGGISTDPAATAEVAMSELPAYDGIDSETALTTFTFDPPVPVRYGDAIVVLFDPDDEAVAAVDDTDPYEDGYMTGFAGEVSSAYDFAALLSID